MIKVVLNGALGRMGSALAGELSGEKDIVLAGAVEAPGHPGIGSRIGPVPVTGDLAAAAGNADVVVDFTSPSSSAAALQVCLSARKAFITGTTGLPTEYMDEARRASLVIPVLVSPNMSAGVNILFSTVEEFARALPDFDIEIVEMHHNRKKDSPSGTAARIAEIAKKVRGGGRCVYGREGLPGERKKDEIGVHSLRGGDVAGDHTVIFAADGERLELTHRANSRRTFARGTIRAIRFIKGKGPGLYTMADVLGL